MAGADVLWKKKYYSVVADFDLMWEKNIVDWFADKPAGQSAYR